MRIYGTFTALKLSMIGGIWLAVSGFTCPMFCTEQTDIQVSYLDARDTCRNYAEEKLAAMGADGGGAEAEKTRLVAMFSDCMKTKGWDVPGPSGVAVAAAPNTQPANGAPSAGATNIAYSQQEIARAADCAWARQNASNNPIAATRAEACDIECRQRLRANPYGPRPAACGPEYPEDRVRKRIAGNLEGEMTPAAGVAEPPPPPKKKVMKKKPKPKKKAVKKKKPGSTSGCDMPNPQAMLDKAIAGTGCAETDQESKPESDDKK